MKRAILTILLFPALTAFCEKQSFERYQSVVDRQMFGPLPPDFDPNRLPSEVQKTTSKEEKELQKEQEKLQSAIHFSVINVTPGGETAVGFTDNSDPKVPRHYYLKVGESRDGWEVKEADAQTAKMTIAKGEIEVTLSLGGNSAKDGGTSKAGRSFAKPAASHAGGGLFGGGSLSARRQKRQQENNALIARLQEENAKREAERQAREAAEKAEREAERAEQRQQLLVIQEELKRAREAKNAEKREGSNEENKAE